MNRDQGRNSGVIAGGIPRWITGINLAAILVALAIVVPNQVRASHTPAPTGLSIVSRLSPTAPKLAWSDSSSSATIQGYILQRSRSADFTSSVIEIRIARNTFDFIDETVESNVRLYYRIASYAGTDRSGWSNTVNGLNGTATYPGKPAAPTNISVEAQSGGLRISWSNPATNETGVWVQRSADNGTTWEYRASLSLNSTSYFDNDPPAGAPMYRVATFNSSGATYSYSVQYVNQNAPGVPTLGPIAPSIPQFSIPGVPSIGVPTVGIPTLPGISVPPGLIPSNPATIANPWLSMVPSNPATIADPWLSLVPSNPSTLIPTINPSTLIPTVRDPNTYRLWTGVRLGGSQNPPFGLWISPASCAGFACPPPNNSTPGLTCVIVFFGVIDYCYLIDVSLT